MTMKLPKTTRNGDVAVKVASMDNKTALNALVKQW
ncbi:hypothetical protein PF007_g32040 [Phytophthora fragariae]|uniref:Uncharacterized protein n=1 Tax=Phytophthora fragariae TaxID=53985 RepID=A0A6A3PQS2_9STRA|nr:hypothetical protein PF007_g32040 [Phytophthora fragariae]